MLCPSLPLNMHPYLQVSFVILVVKSTDLKSHHLQEPSLPLFSHSTSFHISACISVSYVPLFSESVLKVVTLKAMFFLVVMYGCESWTIKKTERWRVDAFELWYRKGLLSVLWTVRWNQSMRKEINPEYSLEGLMLKLKLQYFGHLRWRTNSLEKTLMWERLMAGGEGGNREWDGWLASPTQWTWVWANFRTVEDRGAWRAAVHGVTKSQAWLSNWMD